MTTVHPEGLSVAQDRALEARVRRMARTQGLRLVKSRSRTWEHPTFGTYGLLDALTGFGVLYDTRFGFGFGLDEVRDYLTVADTTATGS